MCPELDQTYERRCIEWQNKVIKVKSEKDPSKEYEVKVDWRVLDNPRPLQQYPFRENPYYCNCEAYKFQKGKKGKNCKHIDKVKDQFCLWDSFADCGNFPQLVEDIPDNDEDICPRCGGKVEVYINMV